MNDAEKFPSLPPRKMGRRDFCFAFAVVGTAFVVLAMKTWRKWPDLLVDFGLQLYCPWKISTGSVLYRDIGYLVGGPLSQYYHALLFKVFGVSLLTLVISNLVIAAVLVMVIHCCFYQCSDQLTAITASLAVVAVFVFAQFTSLGIFNYITPYCSEIVHGLALSVFALALLAKWFREEKLRLAAAPGFFCGLTFLTKPEVFLALGLTVSAGLLLFWRVKRKSAFLLRSLGIMMAAAFIPLLAFFLYFLGRMNFRDAWQSVCEGWVFVLATRASDNPYYQWCMGLDEPGVHLQRMFTDALGLAIIVGAAAWLCRRRAPAWLSYSLLVPVVAGLAALAPRFVWADRGQCLPLVCVALLALLLWRARVSELEPRAVFPLLWTVFSLGLLIKLGLFSRLWHYGFVLAMPAFLCAIYLLVWLLPRELERWNVHPGCLRLLLWTPLMFGLAELHMYSMLPYDGKTVPLGAGADKIWVYNPYYRPNDSDVIMAMRWMETNAPPQATLAVLPEGAMLNFLSRRTNPGRYLNWTPPALAGFGQQNMTDDFIRHSPDYIILVGMNFDEFGEKYFGVNKSCGKDLMEWISAHYESECLIGDDWLKSGRFGVRIFKKSAASGVATGRRE